MQGLADELGIDRTTLFRWVGNRDQLVVSAIASITLPTLRRVIASAEGSGTAKIVYLIVRIIESFAFSDLIAGNDPDWTKVGPAVAALLSTG